ncbi:integrase, catalytic region, zinc finger, CCHC-type containing protein [Tanacetum coccineum]|uniref:Integrase, catalytic region, zinc finger, CCHC-type containing protein n=1 Tax=Tanacetum coccineum TaxID=301880 RepID=A0ABQ5EKH8_9ASTR
MTTLAEFMILSGGDNRPPMLDKDLYDSRKSLPSDIYSLVNHHRVAKDLWERIQLLMQGNGKVLNEEEMEFLADPGIEKISIAKAVLMANLSSYDSDVLSKVNKNNLIANETLSAELERYKERVKLLEERQNVDLGTREKLIIDDIIRDKNAQFADFEKETNSLKQTISEQLKEKETLTKTFNVLKNKSKEKESKNIDKEIALEKKVEEWDNIIYKMGQFALMLYDGNVISKETNVISIDDSEETLMLEEESRSKMILKQIDPMVLEKKFNIKPFQMSNPSTDSSNASHVKVDVPSELPKKRITPDALTEGVKPSTSASGSKPSGNTKNDRISQPPSSNEKNKVEVQSRKVKSSLNKKNSNSKNICNEHVKHSVKGADALCSICNELLFDANHAMCLIDHVKSMNAHAKSSSNKNGKRKEWKSTRKVITATNEVPIREPIPVKVVAQEPIVTKVYTRRPKVVQIVLWYLDSGCSKHMTRDRSQLTNFVHKFLGTVKFGNDQVAKIIGYGDYQIGNNIISRVYYVEGLGHNLFSVGQFCDSNQEVAFRKRTCFVRNLEGVDLLSGSQGTNLYSLSIGDMMASSPICLLSKSTKTKSWLWHRHLSHLNFGAINHLARHGLVRGLPRLRFEKDNLCSACAMGKSKK